MNRKIRMISIYPLTIICMFLLLFNSCKKKDEVNDAINFNPLITYGSMTDQDGNTYKTVTICNQTWMAEDLKAIKYRNGDLIPNAISGTQWDTTKNGAYCDYENNPNNSVHGKIYNWYVVKDIRNIAPIGWHVPSDSEWTTLINCLGQDSAGAKLKEKGITHWNSPNSSATNSSGFTAISMGSRYGYDLFFGKGGGAGWWSSTEYSSTDAIHRSLSSSNEIVGRYNSIKTFGISIRCVKD